MRSIPVALGALALLTACTGTTPTTSNNTTTPTVTTGQPGSTPTQAPPATVTLSASSTLSVDGKAITAFEATPKVTFVQGANNTSTVAASTGTSTAQLTERRWIVAVTFKSLKTKTGMTKTFKAEDIDRLDVRLEEQVPDRYSGNKWEGTFDVPANAKVTVKNDGGRVYGLVEATVQPGKTNEAASNKPVTVRFEFENELK